MRILVTGREGQLARSLAERAAGRPDIELVTLGRPDLDLESPGSAEAAIARIAPDLVINAAAYTAVDKAEDEPERAMRVNGEAPGEIAHAASVAGAQLIHVSTDYVFDGDLDRSYREEDRTGPLGVYGRSKLAGEMAVREAAPRSTIVRTAWVYSPFGANFLKTMMRLAENRDEVNVVADQVGNPSSALDLADGLFAMADAYAGGLELGHLYHLAGRGDASWADFASEIFAQCAAAHLPSARVNPIRTEDWPTQTRRPANSRLDSCRFTEEFGFAMPDWRDSVRETVLRLAAAQRGELSSGAGRG